MIKIVSGWSNKGGSTTALIDLTNELNKHGIDTTFYGPHEWHLDKCKSGLTNQLVLNKDDILITHFIQLPSRPSVKKVILSCHEKWWFRVGQINQYWDTLVFLHQAHRDYHDDYKGDCTIIPNLQPDLKSKDKPELDKVAGIIGAIEDRKQTHKSIQRAMVDGCEKVKLFGSVNDENYFKRYVEPLLSDVVELVGYADNKQDMYDSIGRVYHSSKGEVACLVKDECYLTNTKFFGNEETENEVFKGTNEEIIEMWKKVLGI